MERSEVKPVGPVVWNPGWLSESVTGTRFGIFSYFKLTFHCRAIAKMNDIGNIADVEIINRPISSRFYGYAKFTLIG
jgi:hypothetical protein